MKTINIRLMNRVAGLIFKGGGRVQVYTLVALTLALMPCVSQAGTKIWTGAGGNRWTGSGNWNPTGLLSLGDDVIFDGTGINLDTTTWTGVSALRSISFTSGQTATVTINNPTNNLQLSLTYSGIALNVVTGDHKFVGINTGAGTDIKIGAAASTNYVSTGASFEIQGRLNQNSTSDNYVKIGGGTLILSGNNGGSGGWNFTAGSGFKIQEGALRFAASGAAGNSANNFSVSSGAAIEISGGTTIQVGNGSWTLNGSGVSGAGALRSVSGNNALTSSGSGTIALASASSIGVDSDTLSVRRVISGTNALTKVGGGTLLFSTTNTYSGHSMIVEGGTLAFGTNNAISASSPISLSGGTIAVGTYSNALSTATLTQDSSIDLWNGTGTLSFSGGMGTWSGTLSLTGTLGEKTLRFGTDANGLTAEQQAKIKLNGYSTKLNSQGYVVLLRGTVLMIF